MCEDQLGELTFTVLLSLQTSPPTEVNGVIWPAETSHILKAFRLTDTGEQHRGSFSGGKEHLQHLISGY